MMNFFCPELLETDYVKKLRASDEGSKACGLFNPFRSCQVLLENLSLAFEYNPNQATRFSKRIISEQRDFKNCEAIFTEIIVYTFYLRLFREGILKSIDCVQDDYDLRIIMRDGVEHYLEVFSLMPEIKNDDRSHLMSTHLQDDVNSVRQKLYRKIEKQKQLSKSRLNYAVIEANRPIIADDFTFLFSFSNGYKIQINTKTGRSISEGFDWSDNVFGLELTQHIRGILYFFMGDYNNRRFLLNPNFKPD